MVQGQTVSWLETMNKPGRAWLSLAVASLLMAGILAGLLVVARMPPFASLVTDPLFFKRCLVVHVDLSLFVWFLSFIRFLMVSALPMPRNQAWEHLAFGSSAGGVLLWMACPFLTNAQPVLCNYLPVIDHPIFLVGLVLFALGLLLGILSQFLFGEGGLAASPLPQAAQPGLTVAGLIVLLAMLTTYSTYLATPQHLDQTTYWEVLFWGGGHIAQFAFVAGMLVCWLYLLEGISGKPVLTQASARLLFLLLLLPCLVAPLLPLWGTTGAIYLRSFTLFMQWGIFPVTLILLSLCIRHLHHHGWHGLASAAGYAWLTSVALTLTGFVLGAMIRGSNTLVPAHYHANIGAVTVAFMACGLLALQARQGGASWSRWLRRQPMLFGIGQLVFASGFALAGAHGMSRKVYGAEQHIRTTSEYIGLTIMGVGGLIAIMGGVLFLSLALSGLRRSFGLGRKDPSQVIGNLDLKKEEL
jgi:hypothetical protein